MTRGDDGEKRQFSIKIPKEIWDEAWMIHSQTGVPVAHVLTEILRRGLEKKQEGVAALKASRKKKT